MKKILIISVMSLLLANCTSLQETYKEYLASFNKRQTESSTTADSESKITEVSKEDDVNEIEEETEKLEQERFYLSDSGVIYLSDLLKQEKALDVIREKKLNNKKTPFEVYMTETLIIKDISANNFRVLSAPVKDDFLLELNGGSLTFSSSFQGEYRIELLNDLESVATIKIKNIAKHLIEEKELYSIILDSFNAKNIELLDKSSQLYLYYFPTSKKQKDVLFMVLSLNSSKLGQGRFYEKVKYLRDNYVLNEEEKVKLLGIEKMNNSSRFFSINDYYLDYDRKNSKLNDTIVKYAMELDSLRPSEISFLNKVYQDTKDQKLGKYLEEIALKNGDLVGAKSYVTEEQSKEVERNVESLNLNNRSEENMTKTENEISSTPETDLKRGIEAYKRRSYNEAIIFLNKVDQENFENSTVNYYRGLTYFYLKNYELAIKNFEKVNLTSENMAEIYYYQGVSYNFIENKDKAREYLNKAKEIDAKSIWGRKSSIYLLKI